MMTTTTTSPIPVCLLLLLLSLAAVASAMDPEEALCQDVCERQGEAEPEECLFICEQIITGQITLPYEEEPIVEEDPYIDNGIDKRQKSAFVRIGRQKSSFVRIGKKNSYDDLINKRPSSFVRIGKSYFKRPSSFVRIGRSIHDDMENEAEKRASNFVRIGKAYAGMLERNARPSSFVRIGKRPSSFVRIGKRPSSFVRKHHANVIASSPKYVPKEKEPTLAEVQLKAQEKHEE